ncbi:glycosyltransferase family 4 protein [Agrococcus sp. Ld7]|uniref:glycosyltransferase family 4 protein n=1 Tax=Agrococcus sp. Ld7 TaxID=649148 RepID=UPI0038652256
MTAHAGIAVHDELAPDPRHPERWWPPVMLDADWIRDHAADFDVLHVHFGMESLPAGRLEAAIEALRECNRPLVYTVHDVENPQLTDQGRHLRDLDLLIPRASAVLTLTTAAADDVRRGWGREATVLAHPTLLPLDAPAPAAQERTQRVIGVHLRDLRPNIAAAAAIEALLLALDDHSLASERTVGRVLLNATTRDAPLARHLTDMLRERPDCELIVRDRPDDAALLAEIDELDAALLPYGHGTHSGWVELCFDRGVPVVGPGALAMAGQHPDAYSGFTEPADAGRAVREALAGGTRAGSVARRTLVADRAPARHAERAAIADAHATLYRSLVVGAGAAE